jgi:predicted hydrolase (HD superfamily)
VVLSHSFIVEKNNHPCSRESIFATNNAGAAIMESPLRRYEELIDIILTHNYQHNGYRAPQTTAEWALFTCDELTGFIVAVALVRPEKKLELVEVKSVLKKFPAVAFAKPVDREQIRMCEEKLGIPLEEFVDITLSAMKEISQQLGL